MNTLYTLIKDSETFASFVDASKKTDSVEKTIGEVAGTAVSTDDTHELSGGLTKIGETVEATGPAEIKRPLLVDAIVTFFQKIIIKGEAIIEGTLRVTRVIFGSDTAGVAVIPKWAKSVDVEFDTPYDDPPRITISLVMNSSDATFLSEGVQAAVADVTKGGFKILLENPAPREFEYTWVATAVDRMKRSVGKPLFTEETNDKFQMTNDKSPLRQDSAGRANSNEQYSNNQSSNNEEGITNNDSDKVSSESASVRQDVQNILSTMDSYINLTSSASALISPTPMPELVPFVPTPTPTPLGLIKEDSISIPTGSVEVVRD